MTEHIDDRAPDRCRARRRDQVILATATLVGGLAALFATSGGAVPVIVASVISFLFTARLRRKIRGVPILTYHSVSEKPDWLPWHADISIRPETLDRQLRLLGRMGLVTMDTEAMVRTRLAGKALPDTAIALHFDDGYLDTWVAAAPILGRHGARATVFVSTDFVAPDQPLRHRLDGNTVPRWDGYMTWRELRHLEAHGPFRIEAHGTDHGRVIIGPGMASRISRENVGVLAWVQWQQMPGDKHNWYLRSDWPVPMGTRVNVSAPSLSACRWDQSEGLESEADFANRVRATFAQCRSTFRKQLGRDPVLFCWPQNKTCSRARAIARDAGFLATTGGCGRNETQGDPAVLGRVHVGQDYAGFRCGWLDDLALRAQIRCFQGFAGWSVVIGGIGLLRRAVSRMRPRATHWQPRHMVGPERQS